MLDAFPPELPSRLRFYAIVRCLVDLGLRSREVINLGLDDIGWAAGILRIVKCKSRRVDVMHLPQATGSAIAAYLRSVRPQTANRRVFVRRKLWGAHERKSLTSPWARPRSIPREPHERGLLGRSLCESQGRRTSLPWHAR